jgi:hypothetical protein
METDQTTASADADYALCWTCHDPGKILIESNAFDKLHSSHVKDSGIVCATCHDVHGPSDLGEAGLIKFRTKGASEGFEIDVDRNQGTCNVSCHQDGEPKSYVRDQKRHTVTCLNCH